MPTFSYLVVTKNGKEHKGSIEAETRDAAIEELKQHGNLVVSVEEVGLLSREIKFPFTEKKPDARDLSVFCRQFVSIINAGIPIISAIEMLSDQTENKMLSKALLECRKTIEQGETLAHAMGEWPEVFPSMLVTLVAAGEASGSLEVSFSRMADQFEKDAKVKASIKKATIYPTFLLIAALSAVFIMLTFVVPTFDNMMRDLGTEIPLITAAVLGLARFLNTFWYIVIILIAAAVISLKIFSHSKKGQYFFGKFALKIPLIGRLTVKSASARMSRTLGTLIGAGLPLVDALSITTGTMTNIYFKDVITEAREAVLLGSPLSNQFSRNQLFPPLVCHMIGVGEETGSLEKMLEKLAEYYEDEVESATERVLSALEPAIIVIMAILIGTIVISLVLPLSSMYNSLGSF